VEEAIRNVRKAVQAYMEDLRGGGEIIANDNEILANVELDAQVACSFRRGSSKSPLEDWL
jgi:hypothetical protein